MEQYMGQKDTLHANDGNHHISAEEVPAKMDWDVPEMDWDVPEMYLRWTGMYLRCT